MSNLQSRINALVPTLTGWCSAAKAYDLALAIIKLKAEKSLEIGVWGGKSCLPMALAHQEQDFGHVIAIDPWSATESVVGYDKANSDWWGAQDHEKVYQNFMASITAHGLAKYVRVIRKKSDDVEPPDGLGVIHLDGLHTDQAVRDVERFAPKIIPGGFIFADDVNWSGGGVQRAVEKLLTMGFVKIFERDTGAMFQRQAKPVVVPRKKHAYRKVKKGSVKVVEA